MSRNTHKITGRFLAEKSARRRPRWSRWKSPSHSWW